MDILKTTFILKWSSLLCWQNYYVRVSLWRQHSYYSLRLSCTHSCIFSWVIALCSVVAETALHPWICLSSSCADVLYISGAALHRILYSLCGALLIITGLCLLAALLLVAGLAWGLRLRATTTAAIVLLVLLLATGDNKNQTNEQLNLKTLNKYLQWLYMMYQQS